MESQSVDSSKIALVGVVALLLGIIHNVLFFDQGLGLNFPIFIVFVVVGAKILIRRPKEDFHRSSLLLLIPLIFFSVMVFVRSSALLTFFNIIGCLLLLLTLIDLYGGRSITNYLPGKYLRVFVLPLILVPYFFKVFSEIFALRKVGISNSRTREIVRGTIMALVAIIVFGSLFASADLVFGRFFHQIFSFNIDSIVFARVVWTAIITAFFLASFGYMFKGGGKTTTAELPRKSGSLGTIELTILLTSINSLFLLFIILQLTYLFGGETHILSQGLVYAEYARKGFYELILVAILSFVIISVAEDQIMKRENLHHISFRVLATTLIGQVVAILISAFYRLSLYEHAYGFSTIRLYSYAFMIWMGVISVLMAHHIITNGERTKFATKAFVSVLLLLFAMNILNPDAFIAKRNLERYQKIGKIDAEYLGSLSYDAIPYTIILLNDSDEKIKRQFAHQLWWENAIFDPVTYENVKSNLDNTNWRSARLSRSRATLLLAPYRSLIEDNENFYNEE